MTILRFRYEEIECPASMIAALRALTGLSIADIRNRIATSQPLFEIVAFRRIGVKLDTSWFESQNKSRRDDATPRHEESNGFVTPVQFRCSRTLSHIYGKLN